MITVVLPYPLDYPKLADYMKALKPVRKQWDFLTRNAQWRSPAEMWQWCWQQPEAKECAA